MNYRGRTRPPLTEAEKDAVVAAYHTDMPLREIALTCGVSIPSIHKILCVHGVERNWRKGHSRADDEVMLRRYADGEDTIVLSREYGMTVESIANAARRHGIYRHVKDFGLAEERIAALVQRIGVGGEKVVDVAAEIGLSSDNLARMLHRHGVGRLTRRKKVNHAAFSNVLQSEEAQYWVGFLMADGCVHSYEKHKWGLTLFLQERDKDHVERFRSFVGSEHKLQLRKAKARKRETKRHRAWGITFQSKEIVADLARYGVVPRKSQCAKVVGLEMNRHFWRGVIDGDGCIGFSHKKYRTDAILSLLGTEALVHQFMEFVRTITETQARVRRHKKNGNNFVVSLSHWRAVAVLRVLYGDCLVALSRKHAKAMKAIHLREPAAGLFATLL
jgi:hypothetical protein